MERITDLLSHSNTAKLSIREDPVKGLFVENLSQVRVTAAECACQQSLSYHVAAVSRLVA
jgi:hypothetical protein